MFALRVVMTNLCCCFTDYDTLRKYNKVRATSEALLRLSLGCKLRAT